MGWASSLSVATGRLLALAGDPSRSLTDALAEAVRQVASQAVTGTLPSKNLHRAVLLSDDATAVYLVRS
jgi:hypothetical protein